MGNYHLDLPPVLDADNRPMTVEESEQSLKEPETIRFEITRDGALKKYVVLCDLNNVDGAALDEFDVFKNRQYAVFHQSKRAKSFRAGKKVEEDETANENEVTGEQAIQMAKMKPEQRRVFLALLFPPDWETNPVVLASNLPDMPREAPALKAWFERSGPIAQTVMEEIVMTIDPTGPLAQDRKRQREAEKMESEMMQAMNQQLESLKNLSLSSSHAPSSTPPETAPEPSALNFLEPEPKEGEPLEPEPPKPTPNENGGSPSGEAGAIESADAASS